MPNRSRIAASLAPAYFHHCRSKARISRSRSDSASPEAAGAAPPSGGTGWGAGAMGPPRTARRMTQVSFAVAIQAQAAGPEGHPRRTVRTSLRVEAAGAVSLRDPADADHLRGGAQRDALLLRE